jgi:hypothetical protein
VGTSPLPVRFISLFSQVESAKIDMRGHDELIRNQAPFDPGLEGLGSRCRTGSGLHNFSMSQLSLARPFATAVMSVMAILVICSQCWRLSVLHV